MLRLAFLLIIAVVAMLASWQIVTTDPGTVEVEWFGTPLHRFRQWRRIGYVPQRVGAGSGVPATVAEVVSSGRLARRGVLRPPGRADRAAVRAALDAVGLADRAGDPVATLRTALGCS